MNTYHYPILFHHGLVKVIVLHQLAEKNMTWDAIIELALHMHSTTTPTQEQNISPPMSAQPMEVGSSSKHDEFSKRPRPEVTLTYQRGRRLVFYPQNEEGAKPTSL